MKMHETKKSTYEIFSWIPRQLGSKKAKKLIKINKTTFGIVYIYNRRGQHKFLQKVVFNEK